MNLKRNTLPRLAACAALASVLAACSSSDGGSGSTGGTGGTGAASTTPNILDPSQTQVSGILTGLGNQLSVIDNSGSPLKVGAFVKCLDPTLNQLLDGPDGLLTNLLKTVNGGLATGPGALSSVLTPATLQGGAGDLAIALQSLTTNLPNALLTLVGQGTCAGGTTGGSNPLAYLQSLATQGGANNPLAPLLNALTSAGVPSNGGGTGPTNTPLDVILGPLSKLAGGAGAPTDAATLATVINQLASGLITLNNAVITNIPNQAQNAPVVGDALSLVTDALGNIGVVLTDLNNAGTTNAQLLGTLNSLAKDLAATLAVIPGSSTVAAPLLSQVTGGVTTLSAVTTPLTSLLATVASIPLGTSSGSTLLSSLTSTLNTSGTTSTTTATGTSGSTTLSTIPIIGPILGLLGL